MRRLPLFVLAGVAAGTGVAHAHVSVSSGPAAANKSQKITFGVGHGCTGADTIGIRIVIPTGLTSVRAIYSDFGKPTIEGTPTAVTAVSWRKPLADLQDVDVGYYEITIRARIADVPFSKIYFRVEQTCRTSAGVETTVNWSALPGETGNEAAALLVVPARTPGWNKYTVPATVTLADADLPVFLGDSLIVWRGTSAYSSNPATVTMISSTTGVTPLTGGLAAGQEIWVKY